MASYSTNEFRGGLKIILDGEPFTIVENEFVKPGKGQAFNRVRVRNLKTGRVIERTFKSGESVELNGIFQDDHVQPSASSSSAGCGSEFMSDTSHVLSILIKKLSRERT